MTAIDRDLIRVGFSVEQAAHVGINQGWSQINDTLTYASANSVTVASVVPYLVLGGKVMFTQGGNVKYFFIDGGSGTTTISLNGGTDYTVANSAITDAWFSYDKTPSGWPDWFNYTPTVKDDAGRNLNNRTWDFAQFKLVGKRSIELNIRGTGDLPVANSGYLDISVFSATINAGTYLPAFGNSSTYGLECQMGFAGGSAAPSFIRLYRINGGAFPYSALKDTLSYGINGIYRFIT
jgi:hypothetical protein